jgi:HNH endonuclease
MRCSVDECDQDKFARGWCRSHYNRFYKSGLEPLDKTLVWTVESALKNCIPNGECLEWPGSPNQKYPTIRHKQKNYLAHRLLYHLATGEDIDNIHIHHKCANTRCCNPEHLEPATQALNTLEMLARSDYEAQIASLTARVQHLEALLQALGVRT